MKKKNLLEKGKHILKLWKCIFQINKNNAFMGLYLRFIFVKMKLFSKDYSTIKQLKNLNLVKNRPWTYKKLHWKGEPNRFSG